MTAPLRRARSMAELAEMESRTENPDDVPASIASYRPRPSDIVISPFAKCGTTWLQQTFHTLRTRGDMDFDDISRVVPWIETARVLGIDLEAPQRAEPRGFKSHLAYDKVPKGARYVVSLRDPKYALVSLHHFLEGWFLERGSVSITEFFQARREKADTEGYWPHLISWWEQRDNPDVLLLSYEEMMADGAGCVRRLAAFCGIALDDALLALTLERSSRAYMLQHKDRFDDLMMRTMSEARCNLPPGSDSAKVREAGARGLPPEVDAAMDAIWRRVVTPRLGFASYVELEAEMRRRRGPTYPASRA